MTYYNFHYPADTVNPLELQPGTSFKDFINTMQITTFDFTSFADITIYVNFTALQSIPVAINTLTNMFAASYGFNTTVRLTSQPLIAAVDTGYDYAAFAGVMFVGFAVLFPPIGVSMEHVEDRETRDGFICQFFLI